jgi:two-component system, NtrC family, response regulator
MKNRLLIIEDETSLAKQLKWALKKDYEITIASDAVQAKSLIASKGFHVIALDLGLPPFPDTPEVGLKLLKEIPGLSPFSKVIVITGNSEEEHAINAIGLGASDFCCKPIELKLLEIILSRTFRIYELEAANRSLQERATAPGGLCGMLGISEPMIKLFERIRQVGITEYPVLITGESGTGKEKAACAVHSLSRRSDRPLIIINCGAIPENLLESELFGHEKGAFTGAVQRKVGRFEHAHGSTVFLDEIGDMPLTLQVKILRFLQEGTIERVGGIATVKVDARIIAATNRDLVRATQEGSFREDLYHRLNVIPVELPALRERGEDIVVLAQHFLREEMKVAARGSQVTFSASAIAALTAHSWPGNVRELQNRIRRGISSQTPVIEPAHLGLDESNALSEDLGLATLQQARDRGEVEAVRRAMMVSGNNISHAARLLNITRPTLHDLLKKHRIERK